VLALVLWLGQTKAEEVVEDDMVIVEAASSRQKRDAEEETSVVEAEESEREGKQFFFGTGYPFTQGSQYPFVIQRQWGMPISSGRHCYTSKGYSGECVTMKQCYGLLYNLPDSLPSWALGTKDSCITNDLSADRMGYTNSYGVCCSSGHSRFARPQSPRYPVSGIYPAGTMPLVWGQPAQWGKPAQSQRQSSPQQSGQRQGFPGGFGGGFGGQYPGGGFGGQYPGGFPGAGGQYPGGQYPGAGGQYPGGQYPGAGGQYPGGAGGQYPGGGGQYPGGAPGGQYPPAGGAPGGQYPPAGGAPGGGYPQQPQQPQQPVNVPAPAPAPAPSEPESPAEDVVQDARYAQCGQGRNAIRYNEEGEEIEQLQRITGEHPLRVAGGWPADKNEWPWVVMLMNRGRQFCDGSIIDDRHILTAAHCVAQMRASDVATLTVRAGAHSLANSARERGVQDVNVKLVVKHKDFTMQTLHSDIAILVLKKPFKFTETVRPICLPSGRNTYEGKKGTVVGWGLLREGGSRPSVLQELTMEIWNNAQCSATYGSTAPAGIKDTMLCAGQQGQDSCSGDSGGPFVAPKGQNWEQIGVVSWGIGCGKDKYPGVYTRVTHMMDWIEKVRRLYPK